ncbi:MAG: hypothetical protein ACOYVK_12580 [Bacillota bacterium]
MLIIFGGFLVLLLSFYVIYMGSTVGSSMITILGVILLLLSGAIIVMGRMKRNVHLMETYHRCLHDLTVDPDNPILKEKAYKAGKAYYKGRRDNGKVLKVDKMMIEHDISQCCKNKK